MRGRRPAEVELVRYRVVQEALSNIAKHSEANSARVTISRKRNLVTATIHDDGKGFDSGKIMGSGHTGLGLFGMQERLALVAGWLHIESSIGAGTTVIARVPLSAASQGRN